MDCRPTTRKMHSNRNMPFPALGRPGNDDGLPPWIRVLEGDQDDGTGRVVHPGARGDGSHLNGNEVRPGALFDGLEVDPIPVRLNETVAVEAGELLSEDAPDERG